MATAKIDREKLQRIDVRRAAKAAMEYFHALFPDAKDFTLEEVELSDDEKHWLITLGFDVRKATNPVKAYASSLADVLNPPKTQYKVFKVDAFNGEVQSMKIRALSSK